MKKTALFIFLLFLSLNLNIYSKGYDFSVGGCYGFGYNYSYDQFHGFHQAVTIPIIFTYFPGPNNRFSIGFRNKLGYGITIFDKNTDWSSERYEYAVNYFEMPIDHEIYDNLSLFMKMGGDRVKFMLGLGCAFKYNFLNVSDGIISLKSTVAVDPNIDFYYVDPGNFNYFSLGPSFDLNIEILNKKKTFSFVAGIPFEFLIPLKKVSQTHVYSEFESDEFYDYVFLFSDKKQKDYINFQFGLEFTFSFYFFKDMDE